MTLEECLNWTERLGALDYLQQTCLGPRNGRGLSALASDPSLATKVHDRFGFLADWNSAAVAVNEWFDQYVEAAQESNDKLRLERFEELEDGLGQVEYELEESSKLFFSVLGGPRTRGKWIGNRLVLLLAPSGVQIAVSEIQVKVRRDLARLAIALELYKLDHHAYPVDLAALVPTYAAAIPFDRFTEKPLVYRKTPGGYLVYSVGSDGTDNGGTADGFPADIPFRVGN